MTDLQFFTLWGDASDCPVRGGFISDAALSSVWEDAEGADAPADRLSQLGAIWDVAHASIRDIRAFTGLTQAAFALRFCIPRRTLEGWESGRPCPGYVRLLLAQAVGLYHRP